MKNKLQFFEITDLYCKLFSIEISPDVSAFFPVLHSIKNTAN